MIVFATVLACVAIALTLANLLATSRLNDRVDDIAECVRELDNEVAHVDKVFREMIKNRLRARGVKGAGRSVAELEQRAREIQDKLS